MTNTPPQLQVPMEGLFLSPTPPWGASVLVLLDSDKVLLLRKRGEWTPPAITRLPDEPIASCAARALDELTGLVLPMWPVPGTDPAWTVFAAPVGNDRSVRLAAGYDEYEWVSLDDARRRCYRTRRRVPRPRRLGGQMRRRLLRLVVVAAAGWVAAGLVRRRVARRRRTEGHDRCQRDVGHGAQRRHGAYNERTRRAALRIAPGQTRDRLARAPSRARRGVRTQDRRGGRERARQHEGCA